MENNESNPKPQETGGLKLMTVFIGVLALHVVVIGGFTVYHLMSGGGADTDLVTDKNHKGVKVTPDSATVSDGQLADGAVSEKTGTATTPPADAPGTPVVIPASAPETTAANSPSMGPAPSVPAPTVASTPPPALQPTASAPSGPVATSPVITPPATGPDVAAQPEPPTTLDAQPEGSGTPYVVKGHDTLAKIAHRNHIKMAALRSANGLKTDKLHLGERLIIPARTETASTVETPDASEAAAAPVAKPGPDRTLLGDSPTFSKSVAGTRHDKTSMATTGSSRHTYVVAKGDTLTRIARKFHTTSGALMALNSISDARKLRPGQKLRIPSQESRSATSTPAPTPTPATQSPEPEQIQPRATPSAQLANYIN